LVCRKASEEDPGTREDGGSFMIATEWKGAFQDYASPLHEHRSFTGVEGSRCMPKHHLTPGHADVCSRWRRCRSYGGGAFPRWHIPSRAAQPTPFLEHTLRHRRSLGSARRWILRQQPPKSGVRRNRRSPQALIFAFWGAHEMGVGVFDRAWRRCVCDGGVRALTAGRSPGGKLRSMLP